MKKKKRKKIMRRILQESIKVKTLDKWEPLGSRVDYRTLEEGKYFGPFTKSQNQYLVTQGAGDTRVTISLDSLENILKLKDDKI